MKVTAISDLHGNLIDIEPCDLLLICGDISPLEIQRDYIQMTKWIFNEFQEWIMKINCPTIILTPGNHDFWFEKMITQSNTYLFNKLTILIDGETKVYNSTDDKWYKIYGTPWCKQCGHVHTGNHNITACPVYDYVFQEDTEWTNVRVANVSILDESYSIYFKPLTFEL